VLERVGGSYPADFVRSGHASILPFGRHALLSGPVIAETSPCCK
jgi:hypothetical protein